MECQTDTKWYLTLILNDEALFELSFRSVLDSAVSLAEYDAESSPIILRMRHLKRVTRMFLEYQDHCNNIHGMPEVERARKMKYRADR